MSVDYLNGFLATNQKETIEGVQNLIKEKGIKEKMLEEAQNYAQVAANYITDPSKPELPTFPGIPLDSEQDDSIAFYEYMFVLDYLESIGLKFAPTVFRYESQNPSTFNNRTEICAQYPLRQFDRTPLLVQMIEDMRKANQSK